MNKRLYGLAGLTLLLTTASMGAVSYLQGDLKGFDIRQSEQEVGENRIVLSEKGAKASNPAVKVDKTSVEIMSGGRYEIVGVGPEITIQVAAGVEEDVTLVLGGASLQNVVFQSTGTNIIELPPSTKNTLSGGKSGIQATNITITGQGELAITEVEEQGIFSSDDLVLESGTVTIDSKGHGLYSYHESNMDHGNIMLNGGSLQISSALDGDKAGIYAANQLTINDGSIRIDQAETGYFAKQVAIKGGTADLSVQGVGISAETSVEEGALSRIDISGGKTTVLAGQHALSAMGDIVFSGGTSILSTPGSEQGLLSYTGTAQFSGGYLWGAGPISWTLSSQPMVSAEVAGVKGDSITVSRWDGQTVATYDFPTDLSMISFSSPDLVEGESYTLSTTSGGSGQGVAYSQSDLGY